ncbi:MAG: hypothetical protein ABWJ97_03115 [Thermoproteus sp.]
MRAHEGSLAAALVVEGAYLVASSLGVVPLSVYLALGLPLAAFGLVYLALGDKKASLWGGLIALAGMAVASGGTASPLLVIGAALLLIGLFALVRVVKS